MVSGQLEDSLRHDIESYIEGRLSGLKQEIAQLQSELNESLSRLLDRQAEVQMDGSIAASIQEHLRAAHEEGVDLAASESSRAKASSDMAIVKAGISEINEQRSQGDILKALVNRSSSFAPRVAFFVIKGDQAIGWRARGFQGTVGDEAVRQISLATSADTVIGDVAHSKNTWSGGPGSHNEDHLLLNRLGEEPPQRIVAIPLVVRGRTVAVLYADSAGLDSEAINLEALETLVRVAAMGVELLVARNAKRATSPQPADTATEPHDSMSSYAPQDSLSSYVPHDSMSSYSPQDSMSSYVPSTEYDQQPPPPQEAATPFVSEPVQESHGFSSTPVAEPEPVEFVTEPAAAAPEPVTFSQEMPAVTPSDTGTQAPKRRYGMDMDLPVDVASEEERRLHNDARRFARLLVSEIKLYNEQKVVDGRSHSDLYERLREYIDRSREMYDKRVKPEVAKKFDYFHNELVTTLAEGDADKLGDAYPGATVTA